MYETSATFHEINVWDEDTLTYYFQSEEVNSKLKSTTISKSDSNLISYASLLIRFIMFYLSRKEDLTRYEGYMCINQDYESKWYHINKKLFQNFINFCVAIDFFEEKKERSNNQYIKVNTEFIFSILDEEGQWKKSEQEERTRAKEEYEERKEKRRETIVQNRKRNPATADSVFDKLQLTSQNLVENEESFSGEELDRIIKAVKDELGYCYDDIELLYCTKKYWNENYNKNLELSLADFNTLKGCFIDKTIKDIKDFEFTVKDEERLQKAIASYKEYDFKSRNLGTQLRSLLMADNYGKRLKKEVVEEEERRLAEIHNVDYIDPHGMFK